MSRGDEIRQLRRKRHNAALTELGATTGAVGTGTYAGSLLAKNPKLKGKLASVSLGTAIAGGAVGSIGGFRGARVQREDIRRREAQLRVHKHDEKAKVHLAGGHHGRPACGTGPRPASKIVQTSRLPGNVTCNACKRTQEWGRQVGKRLTSLRPAVIATRRSATGVLKPIRRRATVVKTEMSPGRYKPITQMTPEERDDADLSRMSRSAQRPKRPIYGRGKSPYWNPRNMELRELRTHAEQSEPSAHPKIRFNRSFPPERRQAVLDAAPRRLRNTVTVHPGRIPGAGSTTRRVGTRGTAHMWLGENAPPQVINHEFHHSTPSNNFHRILQIAEDPAKTGREEARADANSLKAKVGPRVTSTYEVQAAMHRTGQNRMVPRSMRNVAQRAGEANAFGGGLDPGAYTALRRKLGQPVPSTSRLVANEVRSQPRVVARQVGGALRRKAMNRFGKVDTTMDHRTASRYVRRYGTRGPLPKGLDRNEKMRAYEGRYVALGGPKGEKWGRRARVADRVTGGTVIGGGLAAGTLLATRHPKAAGFLARHGRDAERIGRVAENTALGSATAAAGSEYYHRHAERKQSSYRHSAAGVAASALRRMQDYTP